MSISVFYVEPIKRMAALAYISAVLPTCLPIATPSIFSMSNRFKMCRIYAMPDSTQMI